MPSDLEKFLRWCPDKTVESLREAREERWEFVGPYPVPKGDWPTCMVCDHDELHYSHMNYARRGQSTMDYRAHVQMKCTSCSAIHWFGIPLTEEEYEANGGRRQTTRYRAIIEDLTD